MCMYVYTHSTYTNKHSKYINMNYSQYNYTFV